MNRGPRHPVIVWGISGMCAALLAGTALAQSGQSGSSMTMSTGSDMGTGEWRRADFIPQLSGIDGILQKESADGKTVTIMVNNGRVVGCEMDGKRLPLECVQVKGDQIRVLDQVNAPTLAQLKVPQDAALAFGRGGAGYQQGGNQQFGTTEQPYNGRSAGYGSQGSGSQGSYYSSQQQDQTVTHSNMGATENSSGMWQRPYLGVMLSEADRTDLQQANLAMPRFNSGIMIEQVQPGLPADRAGFQKGDIIVGIDGNQPATAELLRETLSHKNFGDTVTFNVIRSGREKNIPVVLTQPSGTTKKSQTNTTYASPESTPPPPPPETYSSTPPPGPTQSSAYERGWWYNDRNESYRPTK